MLERRYSEIQINTDHVGEFKGTEDSPEVYAKLYLMKTTTAFRELIKFKKRYKYLEYFVYVRTTFNLIQNPVFEMNLLLGAEKSFSLW